MAEEEFATSSAQGANPEHDSKLVDFGFVQALTVGACLKGMDYLPSLNRIRMKFSAGQIIIVNLDRDLSPFQFDTSPTNYYESCFPIIFPESRSFTPLDFAQILIAVSSLHALLVMLDSSEVDAVRSMLLANPGVAPEQLLDRDDRIEFVSAMRGSFFTEVKARTARGLKALQTLVGSVSKEGRELMMTEDRGGIVGERLFQKTGGERIFCGGPAGAFIEQFLRGDDSAGGRLQFSRGHIPAGDEAQQLRRLGIKIGKHAAKKFAQNQRIHDRGFVFRGNRVERVFRDELAAIDGCRKVRFVGSAPIMIGPARSDRQS